MAKSYDEKGIIMLPLENTVCCLELSIEFKELGITQVSEWYWGINGKSQTLFHPIIVDGVTLQCCSYQKQYSTFTVSELLNILPARIGRDNLTIMKIILANDEIEYSAFYIAAYTDSNPANALAKLLIHLINEKQITIEEINACLV